jgi:hypothetical protein
MYPPPIQQLKNESSWFAMCACTHTHAHINLIIQKPFFSLWDQESSLIPHYWQCIFQTPLVKLSSHELQLIHQLTQKSHESLGWQNMNK